jgi:flagellar motility protein MotE (MotC chaperone)
VNRKIINIKKETLVLENILKELNKIDKENLLGLAKVYENMPPEDAASRLEKIDTKFAIKLMKAINSRKAGKILGFVEPKKAAILSEGYGKSLFPERKM